MSFNVTFSLETKFTSWFEIIIRRLIQGVYEFGKKSIIYLPQ